MGAGKVRRNVLQWQVVVSLGASVVFVSSIFESVEGYMGCGIVWMM